MRDITVGACVLLMSGILLIERAHAQREPRLNPIAKAKAEVWAETIIRELDILRSDVLADVREARSRRSLENDCIDLLGGAELFHRLLQRRTTGDKLHRRFHAFDHDLQHFLEDLGRAPALLRSLHRSAHRLQFAGEQLHYFVCQCAPAPEHTLEMIQRQASALQHVTKELNQALFLVSPKRNLRDRINGLSTAFTNSISGFDRLVRRKADLKVLQREYQSVDRSWGNLEKGLELLPGRQNYVFQSRANQIVTIHDRLCKILNVQSTAPQFEILEPSAPRALQQLQGTWLLLSGHAGGTVRNYDVKQLWVFRGKTAVTVLNGKQTSIADVLVSPGRNGIHRIQVSPRSGAGREPATQAIFEIRGNTLRYCTCAPGKPIPSGFITRRGDGWLATTWQRQRP